MTNTPAQRSTSSPIQIVLVVWLVLLTVSFGFLYMRDNAISTRSAEIAFTPDGFEHPVVRLTGAMPDPQVGGQTFPRSNVVAGIQFMDENGDEMGGIGTMVEDRRAMMLCFDHATAEAVCLTRFGENVTFSIMEPPAEGTEVGRTGPERFTFGVLPDEGLSYLRLLDREGRVRIRMEVDSEGRPVVETLDENGAVLFSSAIS